MPAGLTRNRRRQLAAWALGSLGFAAAAVPAHAGDAAKGRELARQHCTRCHIVAGMNTVSIGSTPSFTTIVNSTSDSVDRFRSFYALRPHPAFVRIEGVTPLNDIPSPIAPIHLTSQEVEHIADFAATLKKKE